MITFIDELVEHLLNSPHALAEIKIILPSKRAGTLLKKKLTERLGSTPTFLPQLLSIEELTIEMSGLTSASQTRLQFEMYRAYLLTEKKNPNSFLEFIAWGPGILGDFNEIDRYLLPTDKFFDYLGAVKDLEHWSAVSEPTELVQNYLDFWKSIGRFYAVFNQLLKEQGIGYQGMQYRQAAVNAKEYIANTNEYHLFAGFNALNNAEQDIIQNFLILGKADVIWDIDDYFLSEKAQNTGKFIKGYFKDWSYYKQHPILKGLNCYQLPKKIKAVAISKNIGQAKYIGQLVAELSQNDLENTAIVLGDEALLLPVLTALPSNVTTLNITMGLPLAQVPDASFFEAWILLQQHAKNGNYSAKDLLSFLSQPYSSQLLENDITVLRKKIEEENLIYIRPSRLIDTCAGTQEIARLLFQPWENNALIAVEAILEIIKTLKNRLIPTKNWLQLEYLYAFQEVFGQLQALTHEYEYLKDIKTLQYFYRELLSKETLDFRGDPYAGLQIMGVLETRLLDFKNVIVSSLNEGVLPSGKSQGSFIPFDLKIEHQLPTYREKDAVYAYHFFRLLQRAENIYLLYNNEASGIHSAEKSRFLLQLEIDQLPEHDFSAITANAPVSISAIPEKQIQKTPAIIDKLKKQAQSGFSPSALLAYIRNPVDFYYRYVLGIKELDSIEEVVAHNTLGTIVHESLEQLYLPFLNKKLQVTDIKNILGRVDDELNAQFKKEYNLQNIKTGKNLIIFNVARQFIENLLKKEHDHLEKGADLHVLSCEKQFNVPLNNSKNPVNLRGSVDRIDILDGTTRIIDYKTGNVTATELRLKDWDVLTTDYKKYGKAFQVLCYALMLKKEPGLGLPESLEAGIISFKNLNSGFLSFEVDKNKNIDNVLLEKFEGHLLQLIEEILDLSIPFTEKTPD